MDLSSLHPAPGSRTPAQARRSRSGIRHGQDLRTWSQGSQARARVETPAGIRRWPDAAAAALPKRGFRQSVPAEFEIVNLAALARFEAGTVIDPQVLVEAGLVRAPRAQVKVLANGTLDRRLTVKAHAFSRAGTCGPRSKRRHGRGTRVTDGLLECTAGRGAQEAAPLHGRHARHLSGWRRDPDAGHRRQGPAGLLPGGGE